MKSKEKVEQKEEQEIVPIKMNYVPQCQAGLIEKVGVNKYNELIKATFTWTSKVIKYFGKLDYLFKGKEMLSELITEPSFKDMISIHKEIVSIDGEGILPLLVENIKQLHFEYHIPYTFITKKVCEVHNKSNVVMIGEANYILPLLELIGEETGVNYDGN